MPESSKTPSTSSCEKSFAGRVPRTEYRVTAAGRRALEKYLAHMEALIKAVRE